LSITHTETVTYFALVIFNMVSYFCLSCPWTTLPCSWNDRCFQLVDWDGVSQTICLHWHQTVILLISASWVGRIISMSHHYPAVQFFEIGSHDIAQPGLEFTILLP
jgi:hypothetical protein